jgi:hypothetical protein
MSKYKEQEFKSQTLDTTFSVFMFSHCSFMQILGVFYIQSAYKLSEDFVTP